MEHVIPYRGGIGLAKGSAAAAEMASLVSEPWQVDVCFTSHINVIIPLASVLPVVWTGFSPWHPDNLGAINRRYYGTEGSASKPVLGANKVRRWFCWHIPRRSGQL
jgi:hypothetical protein